MSFWQPKTGHRQRVVAGGLFIRGGDPKLIDRVRLARERLGYGEATATLNGQPL